MLNGLSFPICNKDVKIYDFTVVTMIVAIMKFGNKPW